MTSLTTTYRINDTNLALRKQFIRLTQEDTGVLASLAGWAEKASARIVKEFYDFQFSFPPTASFFESFGRKRGMSASQLRAHLEQAQRGYFIQIFQEARNGGRFGTDFFEKRLGVGRTHNAIDLPLKWYLSSYATYQDLVRKHLRRDFRWRPALRAKAERAIFTVFNYDTQAVCDAFFYDYLATIGMDLGSVEIAHAEHDLSEHYATLKTVVREALRKTLQVSAQLTEASTQLASSADQAGKATSSAAGAIQQVAKGATDQAQSLNNTSAAMGELTKAIETVAKGSQQQASGIERTSTMVTQVSKATTDVAKSTQTVAASAREAMEAAQNGSKAVSRAIEGMARIRSAVDDAAAKIAGLGQQSAEVGKIVSTIDDIAAQTNLLALNAAIEAARAGDQGRGFAVVADEVRALAVRVTEATKEIAKLIEGIQKGVAESVKATERGAKEVAEGAQLAEQSGATLKSITNSVSAVAQQVEQISAATEEMAASADEMAKSVHSVSSVVEQNSAAAEEMSGNSMNVSKTLESVAAVAEQSSAGAEQASAAAQEISAQVQQVVASSQSLAELAKVLQQATAYFKTLDGGRGGNAARHSAGTPGGA